MWVFLPNSMLSIVQKPGDAEVGTLTVRGRVAGDIESVFPDADVIEGAGTDYRYRARIDRELVVNVMADQVRAVAYPNFKGAVKERDRHDAYMGVWSAMLRFQEGGRRRR
jgi:hypothetical protein